MEPSPRSEGLVRPKDGVLASKKPSGVHNPLMDVSMQQNTITAGRDATFNITTTGAEHDPSDNVRKLAKWLSNLNYPQIHKDIYDRVTPGTDTWIFKQLAFKEWLTKKRVNLWGTGIPGSGKTCLVSIIIQYLSVERGVLVVYIYCQYKLALNATQALAAILKQMVEASYEAQDHVEKTLFRSCRQNNTKPSRSELLKTLSEVVHLVPEFVLVVDALDELADDVRAQLMTDLTSLKKPLFVTSRPSVRALPGFDMPDFMVCASEDDFHQFISSKLRNVLKLQPFFKKSAVRTEVIDRIQKKCSGMFLLAALQIHALESEGITSLPELWEALDRLPTTLVKQYELTVNRILDQKPRERELAIQAIIWVTHAANFLSIDELLEALTIDVKKTIVRPEYKTTVETLISACHGILMVDEESKTIRIAHYTAQEFFELHYRSNPVFSDPHKLIANASALYLCRPEISVQYGTINSVSDLLDANRDNPLFYYACINLGYHTYRASNEGTDQPPFYVNQLLSTQPYVLLLLRPLSERVDRVQPVHFFAMYGLAPSLEAELQAFDKLSVLGCSPLFYACLGGHDKIVDLLLGKSKVRWMNNATMFGATPLHAASVNGHVSVVEQLLLPYKQLRQGGKKNTDRLSLLGLSQADINGELPERGSALYLAAENGHTLVAKALLECEGVAPNTSKTTDGWTPLHIAAAKGYEAIVYFLARATGIDVCARTNSGWTALHTASQNGHKLVVRLLIGLPGIDINVKEEEGWTPLHAAVHNNHEEIVRRLLLCRTIAVNVKDKAGWAPLHLAAQYGSTSITRLLLSAEGVNTTITCMKGRTPLHTAAWKGHSSVVHLLLPHYRDRICKLQDSDGWTPLHHAAQYGHHSVVQILLEACRSDGDLASTSGETPLNLAIRSGREDIVQLFLDSSRWQSSIQTRDKRGWTSLHIAAQKGNAPITRQLLASTAIDPNSQGNDGWSPLHLAVEGGFVPVVQLILNAVTSQSQSSVNVNIRERNGWTPLHLAAQRGSEAVTRLLLSSPGIESDRKNNVSWTPLHFAAQAGHQDVVRLLLSSSAPPGIDINCRNDRGRTPLHLATQRGYESVVRLLLDSSEIDVNAQEENGWTPLHFAVQTRHTGVLGMLLGPPRINVNARGRLDWTPLHFAAERGQSRAAKLLIDCQSTLPDAEAKDGWTPCHLSAKNGCDEVLRLLIHSSEVDINRKQKDGWGPLHFAAREGHELSIQLLLETPGIDANIKNAQSCTPLHLAAKYGHLPVVKLLITSPLTDINAQDEHGWTPLHFAVKHERESIVELLVLSPGIDKDIRGTGGPPWDLTPLELVGSKLGEGLRPKGAVQGPTYVAY